MRNQRNEKPRRSLSSKIADRVANRQSGNRGSSYLLLPEGVEIFKPKKEGKYRFNIIPYVAGKKNRDTEAGELDYEFTFWIHTVGEGDDRKSIVCPKKTYGRPCPICEEVERLSKNYVENQDEIKAMKAKQRQLFNIVDARDEENKIQIYETSYFKGFGEMLDKRLRNFDEDDDEDYRDFADIPGGRTLKVTFAEETFNNNKFFAPSSIDFVARKEELPDSIIDKAVVLDSCLKVLDYEQILKLIAGTQDEDEDEEETREQPKARPAARKPEPAEKRGVKDDVDEDEGEEEDEEEEKPVRKQKKPAKPARDEEDEGDDEEEEEEKPAKKPSRKRPEPEDEDEDDGNDEDEEDEKPARKPSRKRPEPEDEDEDEEEEEEEKPRKKADKPKSKKPAEDDEDEDEGDDDEEEDEKPAKKSSKGKGGKCPHGYSWGADCYMYAECDKCDKVDECDAAQDQV